MTINRRNFLQIGSSAATGLWLSGLSSIHALPFENTVAIKGYQLLVLATKWGNNDSWDVFFSKTKEAGYDGAELWLPGDEKDRTEMFAAAAKYNQQIGFLCSDGNRDPQKNFDGFAKALAQAVAAKPLYVNCHTAKDYFTATELKPFFEHTEKVSKSSGVPVYHETHRGRALYSAPLTLQFIRQHPSLRLTLDASHWCNVHESLLEDQQQTLLEVLPRVDHIHARVGHAEGPQVSDPRAPEWKASVDAHMSWWDAVVARKRDAGERLTILTEFGPPDYMPTLPYTRQALANQWEINVHMLQLLRKRYT